MNHPNSLSVICTERGGFFKQKLIHPFLSKTIKPKRNEEK